MTVDLSGASSFLNEFSINGLFDHRNRESSQDSINLIATGVNLSELSQSQEDTTFNVTDGLVDINDKKDGSHHNECDSSDKECSAEWTELRKICWKRPIQGIERCIV